jgi:hypothetical protein
MGSILDAARIAWRAYVIDGVRASGVNQPDKGECINALSITETRVAAVEAGVAGISDAAHVPVLVERTWAALSPIAGSTAGQRAEVTGTDAGTHTDPVVGGSVANEGIYSWSASPAGWQWIHARDTAQSVRDDVGTNPNGPGVAPTVFSSINVFNQKTALIQLLANDDFQISDAYGAAAFRVSPSGVHSKSLSVLRSAVLPRLRTDYEYNLFLAYGQSNSIGWNAHPALSTTASPSALMLSGGVGTLASYPYGSQALVPLVEADAGNTGESPLSGACQMIAALIAVENNLTWANHKFQMVAAAAGEGGTAIASLAKGSTDYTKMMSAVDRMIALAGSVNAPIACQAVPFIQGESDIASTAKATYKTALAQLQADLQTDIQAKTGQTNPVYLFATQVAAHGYYSGGTTPDIALGQYEVAQTNLLVKLVMPLYFIDYNSGDVHFTNIAAKWVGAYMGLAYKRVVLEGRDWKPLAPLRKIVQGNVMTVIFDVPRPPLVLDTVQVSDPGNFGFGVVDSGGSARTITSVEMAGPDRVKITCSGALASTDKVRYAWSPHSGNLPGRLTGPRGCLRDSAGEDLVFDPAGINKPMHNWCVISEL